ncbi:HAMP domain-containing protein [Paenibacillus sp. LMG 31461]|uniref:HAMP domain-containing protein n=1 Tax=Paenibacillus plantarum TaxID=2654975 RepID=A0ABX1X367_9BACL|nr:histidine kinase [Paenibacillus plantarum]NOU62831.1 HAMP domain-containing protein [Paenibacillus plantarum]
MQLRIQTRLFLGFTLLSSILVSSSGYLYFSQTSKDLLDRVEETNMQQLYRYQEALDHIVQDMDRISAQVIYSTDIKNYLIEVNETDSSSFLSFTKRKKYEDLLASFNGPWFIASQINLISLSGFFLTYGKNMSILPDIEQRIEKVHWIKEALQLEGEKLLITPRINEWQENQELFFSLVRSFNFPPALTPAVVEIQQPYELLSETMELGQNKESQAKVFVIDDSGKQFYPNKKENKEQPEIPKLSGKVTEIKGAKSNESDIWIKLRSDYSGLTILIQQPKSVVMEPIIRLQKMTWLLGILGECISLVIAYILSAGIASPIRYLQTRLDKLSLDNMNISTTKKLRNTKEIASLYSTFEDMRTRLNDSLTEVLQAQKRENLAHLQAMYAQMNPHFLFNTLTSMASFAEESGFPEHARISQKLSNMLRYATQSVNNSVSLKQEIRYTIDYLELMQFRYEGQFSYTLLVDSSFDNEPVPKFLLQPLVENSFTHGFQQARPPWEIELSVESNEVNGYWLIRIKDNGSGFSNAAFKETQDLIQELNNGQIRQLDNLSAQGLGHIGIVNTLTRCHLFWNGQVQFTLNNLSRGMEFTISIRREA